jgi:pilus assembly protein CpaB
MNLTGHAPANLPMQTPIVQRMPTAQVLVAKQSLPVGSRLNADSLKWSDWPKDGVVDGFITKSTKPNAVKDMTGKVVRLPIFAGEPLRAEKLVDSNSHIMSSMLPAGKRAVSTEISVATGAGGFILPNDRVDVLMVKRGDGNTFNTDTVLSNIRVLAIDQRIEETADGKKTAVGATATLELSPEQSKILVVAQQMADKLTLALRSTADAGQPDNGGANYLLSGDGGASIQVIRSGTLTSVASSGAAPASTPQPH